MKDEIYLKMLGAAVWESPVPIYVIHVEVDEAGKPVDWRFAYANEAEAKHLSIPLEKLLGRSGIELLPKIGGKWLFPLLRSGLSREDAGFRYLCPEDEALHPSPYHAGRDTGLLPCVDQKLRQDTLC